MKRLRFRCVECGKLTAGRLPRLPWGRKGTGRVGDGTYYFPRRHKVNGEPCPGNVLEAEWVSE